MNTLKKLLAFLLCLVLMLPAFSLADEEADYEAAEKLYQDKEYAAAEAAFAALGDYKDSVKRTRESHERWRSATYQQAVSLYHHKDYEGAKELFDQLGNYEKSKSYSKDCEWRIARIYYLNGKELYKNGQYAQALEQFEIAGNYEDSRKRAEACREAIAAQEQAEREAEYYAQALVLKEQGDWIGARDLLIQAGPYEGATETLYEVLRLMALDNVHTRAQNALDEGDLATAMMLAEFMEDEELKAAVLEKSDGQSIEAFSDEETTYQKALYLRQIGEDAEADRLFTSLGEYRDAAVRAQKVVPKITAQMLRDDNTTEKSEVFVAPDGSKHVYQIFKGVATWVEAKKFCEMLGGHLATIFTPEENQFVYWFMRDSGYLTAYFGLSDEARKGDWVWVTGETCEWFNWHEGEPSRSPRERYGMYFYKHLDGTWNDSHFYEHWEDPGCSYICEWDLE